MVEEHWRRLISVTNWRSEERIRDPKIAKEILISLELRFLHWNVGFRHRTAEESLTLERECLEAMGSMRFERKIRGRAETPEVS